MPEHIRAEPDIRVFTKLHLSNLAFNVHCRMTYWFFVCDSWKAPINFSGRDLKPGMRLCSACNRRTTNALDVDEEEERSSILLCVYCVLFQVVIVKK